MADALLPSAHPETQPEPAHQAMQQAAEWYALLRSGEAGERDRARWRSWLEAQPDHRRAWRYVEAISQRFDPLQATADPRRTADGLWSANQRVLRRRQVLAGLAALAGAGALGWSGWQHGPGALLAWRADHRTATGVIRDVALSDGSRVWLNTATAFDEHYDAGQRRLRLLTGEIFIATAADPARPFLVDTPHGRLRALGTRFSVRLDGDETLLAVYEGAVEVHHRAGAPVIQAGQQLRFDADRLGAIAPADAAHEAWTRGVLVARDLPLSAVAAELRRYRRGHLGVAPEIADLRVFGSFPLGDTDEALDLLAYALPIRVRRTLPWWVSLEAPAP